MPDVLTDITAQAATVPPALAAVPGQPAAVDLLARTIEAGRVTHAYLFAGATGAMVRETARAFAASVMCGDGGCGTCPECSKILRGTHPDCTEVAPLGARAYLVEQIRDIVTQAQYSPVSAKRKVFIIDRADLMNQASANAFLKTLEEPPAGVMFILIAPKETAVLSTILSRCQVVRFRTIPQPEAAEIVTALAKVDPQRAAYAVAACEGSVTAAVDFASAEESWNFRREVFAALASLPRTDAYGAIHAAKAFSDHWMAPVERVKARQEADREREKEFLEPQALKAADARNKREITGVTSESFCRITALMRSWLRDLLLVRQGMADRVANTDVVEDLTRVAAVAGEAGIRKAVAATQRSERLIAYNVGSQHVIDALMVELRAALSDSRCR